MTDNEQQEEVQQQLQRSYNEPKNIMNEELIASGLSCIQKTHDGSSYTFIKLDLNGKRIDDLGSALRNYIHLREINISKNNIADIGEVMHVPYLLVLDASHNQVEQLQFLKDYNQTLQFIQVLNLSNNKLTALTEYSQQSIRHVILNNNLISDCTHWKGHSNIRILEMRKNNLANLEGLNDMPLLEELYLADNQIASLKDLQNLPALKKIHLRGNQIEKLDNVPNLPALEYLNLRGNKIEDEKEFGKLSHLSKLEKLNVKDTPLEEGKGEEIKKETLILLDMLELKFINKDEVTTDDVTDAKNEKEERIKAAKEAAEEERRLAAEKAEEEARERAEAEAAAADQE